MQMRLLKLLIKSIFLIPSFPIVTRKKIQFKSLIFNIRYRISYSDISVIFDIFIRKQYELPGITHSKYIKEKYNYINDNLKKPIILDLGSNIGASAIYFKKIFSKSMIICVEPDEENFKLMEKNLEKISDTLLIHAAISNDNCPLYLVDEGYGSWGFRTKDLLKNSYGTNQRIVQGITINKIIDEQRNNGIPLICKIDIEGAESQIFSQNINIFDEFPLVIIEIHDWMLPWENNSINILRWALKDKREILIKGENIFLYKKI